MCQKHPDLLFLCHVLLDEWRGNNRPVIIGKLTFVQLAVDEREKLTKSLDCRVSGEGLADVVNLPPFVNPDGVWKKKDARHRENFGRDVKQCAVGLPPNSVKLGLDKNFRPLPNRPSDHLLASVLGNIIRNYLEARICGHPVQGAQWHINRLWVSHNATAKRYDVWLDELGWSHGATLIRPELSHAGPVMSTANAGLR